MNLLHRRIERQVSATPAATAISFEDRSRTYRQLDERANQVAWHLAALGVAPDVCVGVCMERSDDMVAALLGVLKAGGAYVPLDPAYPADRLSFMATDARIRVLIGDNTRDARVLLPSATRLTLDRAWWDRQPLQSAPPNVEMTDDHLAYVLYTSGSTGTPKGVQIPHRALVNFLDSMRDEPGLSAEDVLLAVTTLSFDIAGLELWLPLTTGARIALLSRRDATDGRRLLQALPRSRATVLQATPATWRMLIDAGWSGDRRLKALCGGESMPRELAAALLERCRSVWNMYGPTETTIWSTLARIDDAAAPISIGRPIANTTVHIVDDGLQPVSEGATGELMIAGAGLARGYLNRPDLTAEKFIDNPFVPGTRMYRTGDLARMLPNGEIECLGRLDHQIKIRGFRIEPGEIESALARCDGVHQAVVVSCESAAGSQQLVAYVVAGHGVQVEAEELRRSLEAQLPAYMIPAAFVPLERFPLTPNGKIDRKALPAPHALPEHRALMPPRDALEMQLVKIWESALGAGPIGIHDNFFEIGGDSLLAVGVFLRIEEALGLNLPLATLLEAPTIEQLAGLLRAEGWSAKWQSLIPLQAGGSHRPFFCVHGVGGNVLNYRALAGALGADQPFYALQARGLDGTEEPLGSVAQMAAEYSAEIRRLQPEGPYLLGGASFGGNVAFEMARQLHESGEEVALLALFDTYPAGLRRRRQALDAWQAPGPLARLRMHAVRLYRGPNRIIYLKKKVRRVYRRILYRSWQMIDSAYRLFGSPLPRALRKVQQANYRALREYVARPYSGRVTLFLAQAEPREFSDEKTRGWSLLAHGGVHVVRVAGDHLSMLEHPHVLELATALRREIDASRPATGQPAEAQHTF